MWRRTVDRPEWLKPDEKIGWRSVNRITYPFPMTQYGPTYDTEDECRARHPEADDYQRIVVNIVEKNRG